MKQYKEGSLTVLMIGLFWLAGIITVVLYAMVAHLSTLVETREVQMRYWHLLEGGMHSALAHLNENAGQYHQSQAETLLYEGPWLVDPRHTDLAVRLSCTTEGPEKPDGMIDGRLFKGDIPLLHVVWHLRYHDTNKKWRCMRGAQRFD